MAIAPERLGIGIRRHFTTPGVHPYDEVTWEERDARITNYKDGSVAFEQLGVEVPSTWSVNATNILAQKYFRGTLGTDERETSLKQVADRVVNTITAWGVKDGYFADTAEAEAFSAELKHMIVTQKAAFNSPVWFNIGVRGVPQQASACQPFDALVSTPDGQIPIGELVESNAVGQKVFDANGVTKIVAVKHNGRKPVLRVRTKSGHTLDITGDHLVWRSSDGKYGRFLKAEELRVGDKLQWHRREAEGSAEFSTREAAEAALAGWLQSDGFVGQYEGTNRSLTIEAMTVNDDELRWVTEALDQVFGDSIHRKERGVETEDLSLDCRRTRLYGIGLTEFVEKWQLRTRGTAMTIPPSLLTASLPVVAAYLRSLFQAEGYVSQRERAGHIGLDMVSEGIVRGAQQLLARFGIFSRVRFKKEARADRKDCWSLKISPLADRRRFADAVGFVDARKAAKLEATLELAGLPERETKRLEIASIEKLGEMDVYDIQTESGEYLSANVRVHNCFILSVDDSMRSILNWYVEEGTIFKGGSGAGVNLSKIRSSKEAMTGGGTASGPVSFMRGADASAGTIKSGGKTRRAAKMVVLNIDHPDIEEFIWCKAREERKAYALRDAGFDMGLDGDDIHSIQYQNANNSVRVTDEFMQAVLDDADWNLKAVTDGRTVQTLKARKLFRDISQAAWDCADPGVQYDTTINKWHTAPATGPITASNPCSEYVHLDDSACNLASMNLMKFLNPDDSFDVEGFKAGVEVVFTAQEILVGNADYPTEKIAETSRRFRQLGMGYANLGALLMAQGLPYDSDGGRAWAGAITALMTGHSYETSARTAARMGPFAGYTENAEHMQRVLRMHRDAASQIDEELVPPELLSAAQESWDNAVELSELNGVRNSQSTVLAPTGTIGLLMDCDTTGIEPDLSLVKTKKLVGGGTMSIVNQTVPRALDKLGYSADEREAIIAFIAENHTIMGAPGLKDEHKPVFACSMGDNVIQHMGHIRMMGAAQPFLSGAISKTVNLPETATVEDIEDAYMESWKLGLKAVAVYRDNCKLGQPLSTTKKEPAAEAPAAELAPQDLATSAAPVAAAPTISDELAGLEKSYDSNVVVVREPIRERMPKRRRSSTFKFRVADCEGYVTVGEYDDGRPGEIFVRVAKQGSTLAGIMDAFAVSVSLGLQYGVPLATYVNQYCNTRFEPAGMTDDPDLRIASSLIDYIFRRLAVDYLERGQRQELGILTSSERVQPTLPGVEEEATPVHGLVAEEPVAASASPVAANTEPRTSDAPYCSQCGIQMVRAGSCHACPSCGTTSGCS